MSSTETPSDTYYLSIIYDECAARRVLYFQTSAWPTSTNNHKAETERGWSSAVNKSTFYPVYPKEIQLSPHLTVLWVPAPETVSGWLRSAAVNQQVELELASQKESPRFVAQGDRLDVRALISRQVESSCS